MKKDPRDLLGTFRALAPPLREPIVLQRWGLRRVALALAVLPAMVFLLAWAGGQRVLPGRGHRRAPAVCAAPAMP